MILELMQHMIEHGANLDLRSEYFNDFDEIEDMVSAGNIIKTLLNASTDASDEVRGLPPHSKDHLTEACTRIIQAMHEREAVFRSSEPAVLSPSEPGGIFRVPARPKRRLSSSNSQDDLQLHRTSSEVIDASPMAKRRIVARSISPNTASEESDETSE